MVSKKTFWILGLFLSLVGAGEAQAPRAPSEIDWREVTGSPIRGDGEKEWAEAILRQLGPEGQSIFQNWTQVDWRPDPRKPGEYLPVGDSRTTSLRSFEDRLRSEAEELDLAWQEEYEKAVLDFSDAEQWRKSIIATASRIESGLEQTQALALQLDSAREMWVQRISRVGTLVVVGVRLEDDQYMDAPIAIQRLDNLARAQVDRGVLNTKVENRLRDSTGGLEIQRLNIEGSEIQPVGASPVFKWTSSAYYLVQIYRAFPNIVPIDASDHLSDGPRTSRQADPRLRTEFVIPIQDEGDLERLFRGVNDRPQRELEALLHDAERLEGQIKTEISSALQRYESQRNRVQEQKDKTLRTLFGHPPGAVGSQYGDDKGDVGDLEDLISVALGRVKNRRSSRSEVQNWAMSPIECSSGTTTLGEALQDLREAYSVRYSDYRLSHVLGDSRAGRGLRDSARRCAANALGMLSSLARARLEEVIGERELIVWQRERVPVPKLGTAEGTARETVDQMLGVVYNRTRRFLTSKLIWVEESAAGNNLVVKQATEIFDDAIPQAVFFPQIQLHRYEGQESKVLLEILVGISIRYDQMTPSDGRRSPSLSSVPGWSSEAANADVSSTEDSSPIPPPQEESAAQESQCDAMVRHAKERGFGLHTFQGLVAIERAPGVTRAWFLGGASDALYPDELEESLGDLPCGWGWRIPSPVELRSLVRTSEKQGGAGLTLPPEGIWSSEVNPYTGRRRVYIQGQNPDVEERGAVQLPRIAVSDLED